MQHDRDRADAVAQRGLRDRRARPRSSSGSSTSPSRGDALVDLDHALVEHASGRRDRQVEQVRPVLVADAQRVGEAAVDRPAACARPCAPAARWWRPWCPSSPRRSRPAGIGASARQAEQVADALRSRRRGSARGFSDSSLWVHSAPSGRARDDVGEGAAAVDPELPAFFVCNAQGRAGAGLAQRPRELLLGCGDGIYAHAR